MSPRSFFLEYYNSAKLQNIFHFVNVFHAMQAWRRTDLKESCCFYWGGRGNCWSGKSHSVKPFTVGEGAGFRWAHLRAPENCFDYSLVLSFQDEVCVVFWLMIQFVVTLSFSRQQSVQPFMNGDVRPDCDKLLFPFFFAFILQDFLVGKEVCNDQPCSLLILCVIILR